MGAKIKDITGQKFGHLTAIKFDHREEKHTFWLYKCDCGTEIVRRTDHAASAPNASCGCYMEKIIKKAQRIKAPKNEIQAIKNALNIKNITEHVLYKRYKNMLDRCYDPKCSAYKYYGERGIHVCFEWRTKQGFYNFVAWAYRNGFKSDLSIDRIDVNGDYCPENCRWTTAEVQTNNRRNNQLYEYNNQTLTIAQISKELNVSYNILYRLLKKKNYSIEEAVSIINQKQKTGEL